MTANIMKPVADMLDHLAALLNKDFFASIGLDIGDFCLLIHRKRGLYGYCMTSENWTVGDKSAREISLTPFCLTKGKEEIIDTILHEFVHAYNANRGVKDFNGKVHTNKFMTVCETIGLPCVKGDKYGWETSPDYWSYEFRLKVNTVVAKLTPEDQFLLDKVATIIPTLKPKNKNLHVYICPKCGAKARAKADANLICGTCMVKMICKDED